MALVVFCSAVLVLGLVGFRWSWTADRDGQRTVQAPLQPEISASISTLPASVVTPPAHAQPEAQTVKQTMADCDAEAAKDSDGLYFLVIPLVPATIEAASLLMPAGETYELFFLVPSKAAVGGLEDGSLTLSSRQYEFSIIDLTTGKTQKWSSANGLSKFTQPNAAAVSKFRVGFDFADKSTQWSNEYQRQKGICYWVNIRFPSGSLTRNQVNRFPHM